MDKTAIEAYVTQLWDRSIVSEVMEYIRIPNKSPAFDPEWHSHGYMEQAMTRYAQWARRQPLKGMKLEVVQLEGRTPLLVIDIPGSSPDCVLLYGHLDKQPEMTGWREGLDPWTPVLQGERLYGRGASDDGYAMFAGLTAIASLQAAVVGQARCVRLMEACEESGSFDLPPYIEHLGGRIGTPTLVIALDSGCDNYEQLWCTTSLRGLVGGTLSIELLTEGIHSGASGIVPCSFRVLRTLLSRLEDEATGRILAPEFYVTIPEGRMKQASATAAALRDSVDREFPFVAGALPVREASTNYYGKPAAYTGLGGTIPFMRMLGERFPEAQFLITGVLGPHANAHGPNEFLDIPTAKRLTCCVAQVIADHFRRAAT